MHTISQELIDNGDMEFSYSDEDVLEMKREYIKGEIADFWSLPSYMDAKWLVNDMDRNILDFCHEYEMWQILNIEFIGRLSAFLKHLHRMGGEHHVVEICAGNGKLSYHLRENGLDIRATDNYSTEMRRDSSMVERADFMDALNEYSPEIVLFSWPHPTEQEHVALEALNHPTVKYLIKIDDTSIHGDIYDNSEYMELKRPNLYSLCFLDNKKISYNSSVEIFAKPDVGIKL